MSKLVQGADQLSNDQLLGITDDYTTRAHVDDSTKESGSGSGSGSGSVNPENPDEPVVVKHRRKMHTLTPELLLSQRGLPTLLFNLSKFKFFSDQTKYDKKRYGAHYNDHRVNRSTSDYRKKYKNSYHFANLTNLLYIYQKFGHDIYPKAKFVDFIPMLSNAVNSRVQVKSFLKTCVDTDMKAKREKLLAKSKKDIDSNEVSEDTGSSKDKGRERSASPSIGVNENKILDTSSDRRNVSKGTGLFVEDDEEDDIYSYSSIAHSKSAAVIREEEDDDDQDYSLLQSAQTTINQSSVSKINTTVDVGHEAQDTVDTSAPSKDMDDDDEFSDDDLPDLSTLPDMSKTKNNGNTTNDMDDFDMLLQEQQQNQNNNDFDMNEDELNIMREMDM